MQTVDFSAQTSMGAQAGRMDHGDATPPPPSNEESYNDGGMNSGDTDQFLKEMDKGVSDDGGIGLGAGDKHGNNHMAGDHTGPMQGDEQASPINGNPANGEPNEAVDEADENASNGCKQKKSGKCGKSKKSKKSCKSKKSGKSGKGACCNGAAPPVAQNGTQPTDEVTGVSPTDSSNSSSAMQDKLSQLIASWQSDLDKAFFDLFPLNPGDNSGNGVTGTQPETVNNATNAVPIEPANGNDALIAPNPIKTETMI